MKLAHVYLKEQVYGKAYAEMQAYLRADPEGCFTNKVKKRHAEMESSGVVSASTAPETQLPSANP